MMNPSLFDPVVDLYRDDPEFASEIGNPPLIPLQQVLAKQFAGKSQSADQVPDATFGEGTPAARRRESLAVERIGDWEVMEPRSMQFTDSFRQLSIVFR